MHQTSICKLFRKLSRQCGTYAIAKHMQAIGIPLEAALEILVYTKDLRG